MQSEDPTLSIIIPTYRRSELLRRCLRSVLANDLDGVREIWVVINGEDPSAYQTVAAVNGHDPRLKILPIPRSSRGQCRNRAIANASGDFCYFIDDDVVLNPATVRNLRNKIKSHPSLAVIGGPNHTPRDSPLFERCVGYVWQTLFGAWKMSARVAGTGEDAWVDEKALQLCNLCIRRDLLARRREPFHERLASAEENLLLVQLQEEGHQQLHSPDLAVGHHRRDDWWGFCRQVFSGAAGRFQMIWLEPRSFSPAFCVPTLFLFYGVALVWSHPVWMRAPLAIYALLLAAHALHCAWVEKSAAAGFWALVLFPSCHLSYGCGFLLGGLLWK